MDEPSHKLTNMAWRVYNFLSRPACNADMDHSPLSSTCRSWVKGDGGHVRRAFHRLALSVLILSLVVACGAPHPVQLTPNEIIIRSAARMKALSGFHFVIDRSGAPAFLDPAETIAFRRAEGDYAAPDRARAKVRVIAPGLVAEVQIVSMGENYWETNLLTGEWQALPPNMGFNPAVLFDPKIGLQPILETDLSALELTGVEELSELPGKKLYSVKGELKGERLYEMSYGMIGPEQVSGHLWIAPDTFDLQRIVITTPPKSGKEKTVWQVDFWSFDKKAAIQPPPGSTKP